jgi:hypothetical protein
MVIANGVIDQDKQDLFQPDLISNDFDGIGLVS